jgi:hypothetical protein
MYINQNSIYSVAKFCGKGSLNSSVLRKRDHFGISGVLEAEASEADRDPVDV